jgi:2-dehydro-3-deoxyphosphogluconate aldolase/(4S)-4-hydroxy-2-oxoglutarate aldolase
MAKSAIVEEIIEVGVIPVIRAESAQLAVRAIEAIRAGGVSILEITMTVPEAVEIIREAAARFGDSALIGAGTVLDVETAEKCADAGAQFIVGPALNLDLIAYCRQRELVVMPGALTPTEVVTAWSAGADFVKVFPAGAVGGSAYIRALKAPLPQVRLVPTGGVSLQTAGDFIKAGSAAVGVGSDLVDLKLLRHGQESVITERARRFLDIVREARRSNTA